MPAIQPDRLKRQAIELAERFRNPSSFIRELTHLFEFYADRAHRPGQSGESSTVIPAYRISQPVLKRILSELIPLAEANPESGFELADALWAEPKLEPRLLAVRLLGRTPATDPNLVLDRVMRWTDENKEEALLKALAGDGLANLRRKAPNQLLAVIDGWISSRESGRQKLGLYALAAMLDEPDFENLPVVYRMITPLVADAAKEFRPYLLDIIRSLVQRSMKETALFLQEVATETNSATVKWLIRYSADMFPPEQQKQLRGLLRA